jgi:sec-independent protein translocase protein TatA
VVPLFIGGLSASEIAIVLVIGLLLFGSRLPQVGRSLGKTLTEFKRGLRGMEEDMDKLDRDTDRELDEEARERERRKALPPPDAGHDPHHSGEPTSEKSNVS